MIWTILAWVAGGIVGLVLLYFLSMIAATVYVGIVGNQPKGVVVRVHAPSMCQVGDVFDVVVNVRDTLGKDRRLNNVDFETSYLQGVAIQSIHPAASQSSGRSMLGTTIHEFDQTIAAGTACDVTFRCRAVSAGDFRGSVTVYVDSGSLRYIEQAIRTVVS
jgi:hypothetical protein